MTDPAPTLFTRRVLKGEVGTPVESREKYLGGAATAHQPVLCPSCHDTLYHDINNQWACKCGYRTPGREEIP